MLHSRGRKIERVKKGHWEKAKRDKDEVSQLIVAIRSAVVRLFVAISPITAYNSTYAEWLVACMLSKIAHHVLR